MDAKNKSSILGFINVIISATAMASLPVLGKIAYSVGLGPINTLFLRYSFAFILLSLLLFFWKKTSIVKFTPLIVLQGFFIITASVFYFYTLRYLTAGLTNVIFFTHPVIVAFLAILIYKEKISVKLILGLITALVGIFFISGIGSGNEHFQWTGLLLGTGASVNYALYTLIGQRTAHQTDTMKLTSTLSLISVILLCIVFHDQLPSLLDLNIKQIGVGALIGLLATALAVTFLMRGIALIGASRASLISISEPAITLLIAYLVLGEVLSLREFLGSALVCLSIFFSVYSKSSPQKI